MSSSWDEEQSMELEALQSIYPSELKVISDIVPREYELIVKNSSDDSDDETRISCMLIIRLPPDYPLVPCEIVVHNHENISNDTIAEIQRYVNKLAVESSQSESVAIFTIYSAIQEWLQENGTRASSTSTSTSTGANSASIDATTSTSSDSESHPVIKQASPLGIEAGTIVTLESFTAWKHLFDAERQKIRMSQTSILQQQKQQKLTGKQLFMQNIATDVADEDAESLPLEESGKTDQGDNVKSSVTYFNESLFDEDDEDIPVSDNDEDGGGDGDEVEGTPARK